MKRLLQLIALTAYIACASVSQAIILLMSAAPGVGPVPGNYVIQDTLYASPSEALTAHTPEVGGTWVIRDTGEVVTVDTDGARTYDTTTNYCYNDVTTQTAAKVTVTGSMGTAASSSVLFAAICRTDTSFQNMYYASLKSTGVIQIMKVISGSHTSVTSENSSWTYNQSQEYTIELTCNGTSLSYILYDNTMTQVASDSGTDANISSGYSGFFLGHQVYTRLTNFTAETP